MAEATLAQDATAARLVPSNCRGLFLIGLRHRVDANKVLGSFEGRPHSLIGGEGACETVGGLATTATHPPTRNEIMNGLPRWNQLNELEDRQHSLRSLFSRSSDHWPKDDEGLAEWIPLVDLSEDARGYVLKAELPQVRKEDVKIVLEDGMLTISGDRKFDQNCKKDHRVEHAYGRFAHSFLLPEDARPARVTAVFKNEVLTVHLTRNDKARRRPAAGRGCPAGTVPAGSGLAPPVQQARNTRL